MKTNNQPGRHEAIKLAQPRRNVLKFALGTLLVNTIGGRAFAETIATTLQNQQVPIENFSASLKSEGVVRAPKITKSDAEWRSQLPYASYEVARHAGTEAPYSGEYWNNHAAGIYRCVCCNTALFDAKTKFESGTGWPSFWQPISRLNVVKKIDSSLGMQREEILCARCDGHLGHVFNDGPKPTGLRYCMNSVSLSFVPLA